MLIVSSLAFFACGNVFRFLESLLSTIFKKLNATSIPFSFLKSVFSRRFHSLCGIVACLICGRTIIIQIYRSLFSKRNKNTLIGLCFLLVERQPLQQAPTYFMIHSYIYTPFLLRTSTDLGDSWED